MPRATVSAAVAREASGAQRADAEGNADVRRSRGEEGAPAASSGRGRGTDSTPAGMSPSRACATVKACCFALVFCVWSVVYCCECRTTPPVDAAAGQHTARRRQDHIVHWMPGRHRDCGMPCVARRVHCSVVWSQGTIRCTVHATRCIAARSSSRQRKRSLTSRSRGRTGSAASTDDKRCEGIIRLRLSRRPKP